ncbi:MAG: hypothetical protein AB7U35_02950, partial [Sphingobium sp.]
RSKSSQASNMRSTTARITAESSTIMTLTGDLSALLQVLTVEIADMKWPRMREENQCVTIDRRVR